jgi:hypothetical protein
MLRALIADSFVGKVEFSQCLCVIIKQNGNDQFITVIVNFHFVEKVWNIRSILNVCRVE